MSRIPGYYLKRATVEPEDEEKSFCGKYVVAVHGAAPELTPFPSFSEEKLYVATAAQLKKIPAHKVALKQPIIPKKNGCSGSGYIGIDSKVCTSEPWNRPMQVSRRPVGPASSMQDQRALQVPPKGDCQHDLVPPLDRALRHMGIRMAQKLAPHPERIGTPVRVALIDLDFDGYEHLGKDRIDSSMWEKYSQGKSPFPRMRDQRSRGQRLLPQGTRHGYHIAKIVQLSAPETVIGLFPLPLPSTANRGQLYVMPTDLAALLAVAVKEWRADVVIIPLNDGDWGTPAHLKAILRGAARERGVVIICPTGRIDNNSNAGDTISAALSLDDLPSQPWVIAVGGCNSRDGGWIRDCEETPVSRFGPSVEVCGLADDYGLPGGADEAAVDDTSLACALVGGITALMLRHNPTLRPAEVRMLLRMATEQPAVIDPSEDGLEALQFNHWDKSGHNFKLGYGSPNALLACLGAADPVAYALLATRAVVEQQEQHMATVWEETVHAQAEDSTLCADYLKVRPLLVRLLLRSLEVQHILLPLARHLREIFAVKMHPWFGGGNDGVTDHGALQARILEILDEFKRALAESTDPSLSQSRRLKLWLSRAQTVIACSSGAEIKQFLVRALAGTHFPTIVPGGSVQPTRSAT